MIGLKLDPTTKLIQLAKRKHLCKKNDELKTEDSPRYRIYWEELKKPYVPQAESVSYLDPDGNTIKMDFNMADNFFTNIHDPINIQKLVIEFHKPLGIRSF